MWETESQEEDQEVHYRDKVIPRSYLEGRGGGDARPSQWPVATINVVTVVDNNYCLMVVHPSTGNTLLDATLMYNFMNECRGRQHVYTSNTMTTRVSILTGRQVGPSNQTFCLRPWVIHIENSD